MNALGILGVVVGTFIVAYFVIITLQKTGIINNPSLIDSDNDWILDSIEDKAQQIKDEIKEELTDLKTKVSSKKKK